MSFRSCFNDDKDQQDERISFKVDNERNNLSSGNLLILH